LLPLLRAIVRGAHRIAARIAGGELAGSATLPLDEWTGAAGKIEFAGVELARFSDWHPHARGLGGMLSGTVQAGPAPDPRAHGPLRLDVILTGEEAVYRELRFDGLNTMVYARPGRVLMDVSTLRAAGGEVSFWSRLTWHGPDPFLHVSAEGRDLSLDQIVRTVSPQIGATAGRLRARANAGAYLTHPRRAYGAALATVTESDIGRLPVIAQLYAMMRRDAGTVRPTGRTEAAFRLEGDALELSRLHHFNRGTDIVASMTAENIWLGKDSPVHGVAAAAARPLRDLRLPFGAELDRILQGLQANTVSVSVGGTLGEWKTEVVPFNDVRQTLGRVLGVPEQ
ncbi:MAG: hypothetical protein WD749_04170, partial [Phycisphaerales bacterium]